MEWPDYAQEEALNKYWRIRAIMPGTEGKPVMYSTSWLGLICVIGFVAICVGLVKGILPPAIGLIGVVLCLGIGFLGQKATQAKRKENWMAISAKLLEQEMRYVAGPTGLWNWRVRILCEFNLSSQTYRVTPSLFPSTDQGRKFPQFPPGSEVAKDILLDRIHKIIPNRIIKLLVNPNDPLDCEIEESTWHEVYGESV